MSSPEIEQFVAERPPLERAMFERFDALREEAMFGQVTPGVLRVRVETILIEFIGPEALPKLRPSLDRLMIRYDVRYRSNDTMAALHELFDQLKAIFG
jgi:hypothetical protein